ncbi:protein unc-13 homolog D-like [Halichondria panicea]|uniref:protein unc-13 homolog D-like n=1 Tax=Halichondria panicea TaxID=6063 RepID=UPI00312BA67A
MASQASADSRSRPWLKRERVTTVKFHSPSSSPARELATTTLEAQKEDDEVSKTVSDDSDTLSMADTDSEMDTYDQTTHRKTEIAKMCLIAQRTIINMNEDDQKKNALMDYVRRVFPVSGKWDELLTAAKADKISEWKVVVTVLKATGLPAKDPNGFSDPYVRLGIIRAESRNKQLVKKHNLPDWDRKGLVLGKIHHTSVIEKNLDPEWNERKELKFENVTSEVLVLEVWDRDSKGPIDARSGKITEFTIKGFERFFHNVVVSDDYIGRAFLPLSDITHNGGEKILKLESHSGHHDDRGMLHVLLNIESEQRNLRDHDNPLQEHRLLLRGLVNADSRSESGRYKRNWDGVLSTEADELLKNHSFMISMSDLQRSAIQLNVLIHYHRLFRVSIKTFLLLLVTIQRQYDLSTKVNAPRVQEAEAEEDIDDDDDTSSHQTNAPLQEEWEKDLRHDLVKLLGNLILTFKFHITKFKLNDVSNGSSNDKDDKTQESIRGKRYQKFITYIKVVEELSRIAPLVQCLAEDDKTVSCLVALAVPLAASDWFIDTKPTTEDGGQMQLAKDLDELCSSTHYMCGIALRQIAPLFKKDKSVLDIEYFSHFYLSIDALLSDFVRTRLGQFVAGNDEEPPEYSTMVKVYSSYRSVRSIVALAVQPNVDLKLVNPAKIYLASYHDWYKPIVPILIEAASSDCKERIKRAIADSQPVPISDEVKLSSSVCDSSDILFILFRVRDDLKWPVTGEMLKFTKLIMQEVTSCALFYVQHTSEQMKDEYALDDQELGVTLNDMYHMSIVFNEWPDIIPHLTEEETKDKTNAQHIEDINSVMNVFHSTVAIELSRIIKNIADKVRPEIERNLQELLNAEHIVLPSSYDNLNELGPILPLVSYLGNTLTALSNYLVTDVLLSVLGGIWKVSMEAISLCIESITAEEKPNRVELHERLYYSLMMLKHFNYDKGRGLPYKDLENEEYTDLVHELNILRAATQNLIVQFLSAVGDLQSTQDSEKLGTIFVSTAYLRDSGSVSLEMIQAVDLRSDSRVSQNCACFLTFNPVIEVSLAPEWLFPGLLSKKTRTVRNNNSPTIHESFDFSMAEDLLAQDGPSIIFKVYNQSYGKHYVGMGIIPLKQIPVQTSASEDSGTLVPTKPTDESKIPTQSKPESETQTLGPAKAETSNLPSDSTLPSPPSDYDDGQQTEAVEEASGEGQQREKEKNKSVLLFVWQADDNDLVFNELKKRAKLKNSVAVQFLKRHAVNFKT